MRGYNLLRKTGRLLTKLGGQVIVYAVYVGAVCMFVMMLVGTGDVAAVYVAKTAIPGAFEMIESLMVVVVFAPLAYAQARNRHISVEMLVNRLPERMRAGMRIFALVCGLLVFGLIAWQTSLYAWHSWRIREIAEGLLPLPLYPAKIAIPLGAAMISIRLIVDISQVITTLSGRRKVPG